MPDVALWPRESGHVTSSVMTRICNSEITGREKWMLRNNCWLCGNHREIVFEYTLTLSQIHGIMDRIRADPAQLAVLEAKRGGLLR